MTRSLGHSRSTAKSFTRSWSSSQYSSMIPYTFDGKGVIVNRCAIDLVKVPVQSQTSMLLSCRIIPSALILAFSSFASLSSTATSLFATF